jgi:electron transport complex protein RnfG
MNRPNLGRAAVITLALVTLVAAATVLLLDGTLEEARERARRDAISTMLRHVPMPPHDNTPARDMWLSSQSLPAFGVQQVFRARRNERVVGVYMITSAAGYAGDVRLLIGVRGDGIVTGVHVIEQHETRGYGDRIEHEDAPWLQHFAERSLANPEERLWRVRKDGGEFDAISGATVTSRSVVQAVRDALLFFEAHRAEFLDEP